jgi:hypothetical protein
MAPITTTPKFTTAPKVPFDAARVLGTKTPVAPKVADTTPTQTSVAAATARPSSVSGVRDRRRIASEAVNRLIGEYAHTSRVGMRNRGFCYRNADGVPNIVDTLSAKLGMKKGLGVGLPHVTSPWVAANTFAKDPRFQEVTKEYAGKMPPDGSITFFSPAFEGHAGHIGVNSRRPDGTVTEASDGLQPLPKSDPAKTYRYGQRRVFVLKPEAAEEIFALASKNGGKGLSGTMQQIIAQANTEIKNFQPNTDSVLAAAPASAPVSQGGTPVASSFNMDTPDNMKALNRQITVANLVQGIIPNGGSPGNSVVDPALPPTTIATDVEIPEPPVLP